MKIIIKIDPAFTKAINDLSHALTVLSASGNCMSELIEKGVESSVQPPLNQQSQGQQIQSTMQTQYPNYQQQPEQTQPQNHQQQQQNQVPIQNQQPPVQSQQQYQQPPQQQQAVQNQQQGTVPTTAQSYTVDQLGVAAGPLVDAGKGPELTAWLNQHGAGALTQLDKSQYGEFATYLRSLGAKI